MGAMTVPANPGEALRMLQAGMGFLAGLDQAELPVSVLAEVLRAMERVDAMGAAARGRCLAAFDAKDGHDADGQKTSRAWYVNWIRVTKGQAGDYMAQARLAREFRLLAAALADGHALTKSAALQVAKWLRQIPEEFRAEAEKIVVAAAEAGADLRALAQIIAEIQARTAPPDPDQDEDRRLDRSLTLETTFEGAGVLRGDLTPECSAMVQAVIDALSARDGAEDMRTVPQRHHDALAEAMRRLLASNLLPQRAGAPVKAAVHIPFAELRGMDGASALEDLWIGQAQARWAAYRAGDAVNPGDGGSWLDGPAAHAVLCDAMVVPVVFGDLDPTKFEELITACVRYHHLRTQHHARGDDHAQADDRAQADRAQADDEAQAPDLGSAATGAGATASGGTGPGPSAEEAGQVGGAPAMDPAEDASQGVEALERRILGLVIDLMSGPGGVASFLRRNLLGKGLNGPSLPLDVGQTDEIPAHLRRLVSLRDEGRCQFPGGCERRAVDCEPHHVVHRSDGGHTSLKNLKLYCKYHHHIVFHTWGWKLDVHPDGTCQVTSPDGRVIRSHSPPTRPG